MDKYLQLDLNLPSQRIYGLGERKSNFTLGEGVWTMWADGKESEFDDGKTGSGNSHGVHPFALVQTKTVGEYFGLFFRNTNAQAPIIKYKDHGESTLSYITTGGSIEIYVMLRGSAKEIIKRYHEIIGKPNLPPLWALGWHF
jgi:alpha-glucosidase (family GH31 glycosyl hydrolase)